MEFLLAGVIAALLVDKWFERRSRDVERDAARRERADLLQRIQAPEAAVMQHIEVPPGPLHVPLEDFEAYQEDLKEMGVAFNA